MNYVEKLRGKLDIKDRRENKNRLMDEYVKNLLGIGAKTGAALINPIAGAIVAATVEILDGNTGGAGKEIIDGADGAETRFSQAAGILKGGVDVIDATVNVIKESEKMTSEKQEQQREAWALLLGQNYIIVDVKSDNTSESKYVGVQTEIPSYKTRKIVNYLEKNGIVGFFEENEDDNGGYGTWDDFKEECEKNHRINTPEYKFLSGDKSVTIDMIDVEVLNSIIRDGLSKLETDDKIISFREWLKTKGDE